MPTLYERMNAFLESTNEQPLTQTEISVLGEYIGKERKAIGIACKKIRRDDWHERRYVNDYPEEAVPWLDEIIAAFYRTKQVPTFRPPPPPEPPKQRQRKPVQKPLYSATANHQKNVE